MEFVRRFYEQTRSWDQHKRDVLDGFRDRSDITARVDVPLWVKQFAGEPQTDSVVRFSVQANQMEKYYVRQTNRSGRSLTQQLTRFERSSWLSPESDWMDEALPLQMQLSSQATAWQQIVSRQAEVEEWLGRGAFLLAERSYGEGDGHLIVTWSGFYPSAEGMRANSLGIPRSFHYKPSAEYRQLVAKESLTYLMTRPWVERLVALELSDPVATFITNYQEAYVGELIQWKPADRIEVGFRALPKIHDGNLVTAARNKKLADQDKAYDKLNG